MKKILALLLLATLGRADVVGPTAVQIPDSGGVWPISGSLTYALNNALTGVASSTIDLNGTNGVYVQLTSTSFGLATMTAQALVGVWFSNTNVTPTAGSAPAYVLQSPGNYYLPIKSRYLVFTNNTQKATTRVSAFYYTATPSITVTTSGTTTVTGNVSITASVPLTVTAYIAGSVPLTTTANILSSVPLTTTANIVSSVPLTATVVSNTSSFVSVSTSSYTVLSQTATVLNLTNVAGSANPCLICLTSNGGAAAGFKVQFGTSDTAPGNLTASSVGHYIAASTTSQCWGPFKAGQHAYLAGVAASSSVIFDIQQAQ